MTRTFYPATVKKQVLSRIRSGREMIKDISRSFNIPRGTIFQWWLVNPTYKIHPEIEAKAIEMCETHPALEICKTLVLTKEALADIRLRHGIKRKEVRYPRKIREDKPNELAPIMLKWGVSPELRGRDRRRRLYDHWL